MRVAVIGAGVAGLTAAYQLAKGGASVEVFEAGDAVGGLAQTVNLWGQRVDLGPHRFFSSDPLVGRFWQEAVGPHYRMIDRLTRIYYAKRFFHYPLQPANALRNMGPVTALTCIGSFLAEQLCPSVGPSQEQSFEAWVVGRFGRRLYEMFFKSYSEKLWGISCQDLDADFAAQRIKGFSLGEAIRSAVGFAGRKHKTLVDRFAYPVEGAGMPYERMARFVQANGGEVRLGTPVGRVLQREGRVHGVELDGGAVHDFDHVISTMPLPSLARGLGDLSDDAARSVDALSFRNTVLVYLQVESASLFHDQWLYVHSPELQMGRVTNFRNWVPELYGDSSTSILALEYWCYDEDPLWSQTEDQLIDRARREIESTGLLGGARILGGHVRRLHRSYPVYRRGYREHLARVIEYLERYTGLTVIGRSGAFKYNNQDHSILMGILAAENILAGAGHDLWAVNTDYEEYQEGTGVEPTGLAGCGETA
ncbi:MAG: FAD-dependent oxidoreductase [Deltaproteobacteria bacterium]|nr:FAD-dependent oxidoreductase [Deltaproteobacteria bacterium]